MRLEELESGKPISLSWSEHEIHAKLIQAWKWQLLADGPSVFPNNGRGADVLGSRGRRDGRLDGGFRRVAAHWLRRVDVDSLRV